MSPHFSWLYSVLSKPTCKSALPKHMEHKIKKYTIMASEAGPQKKVQAGGKKLICNKWWPHLQFVLALAGLLLCCAVLYVQYCFFTMMTLRLGPFLL